MQYIFNGYLLFFYPFCIISFWMMPFQTKTNYVSYLIFIAALIPFALNTRKHATIKKNFFIVITAVILITFCFSYGQFTLLLASPGHSKITQEYNLFIAEQAKDYFKFFAVFLLSTSSLTILYKILSYYFKEDKTSIKISYIISSAVGFYLTGLMS